MKLKFGCNQGLPEGVRAAWGARLIWPDDLLWDRQGTFGEENLTQALHAWLNGPDVNKVSTPLKSALAHSQHMTKGIEWRPGDDRVVTLYEDHEGKIVGNPQGSYGYVYVAAWLKEHVPDPEREQLCRYCDRPLSEHVQPPTRQKCSF